MTAADRRAPEGRPDRPRLHRNVWVLAVTSLLTDVSSEMILNLLPLYLMNVLRVRTALVGVIEGVAETTASLLKVVSGVWSDRLRRRKVFAVAGYGLSTLAKPFLYIATSWTAVLGVRFADRVGKGIRTAPRDALLAASVPAERRGLAFGLHRMGDTFGAFLGLAVAAAIVWAVQGGAALLEAATFRWVVLASILPAVAAVVVLALGAREVESGAGEAGPRAPGSIEPGPAMSGGPAPGAIPATKVGPPDQPEPLAPLGRPYWTFLGIMVLFTLGNSSDAFLILRGQERGLSVLGVTGMLLSFNALYTLLSGPAGWLSDRIGRRRIILAGWVVYAAVYLGFTLACTAAQVWVLFTLYGVYYALTEGIARALIGDLVPAARRGTAYGYYHAAVGLTALPASLVAGVLWQGLGAWPGLGPAAPFAFGAACAAAAALLFTLWRRTP
jgi:MFS family permease